MPNITAKINVNTASGPQQVSVALPSAQAAQNSSLQLKLLGDVAVSYTHLTLPTICSV